MKKNQPNRLFLTKIKKVLNTYTLKIVLLLSLFFTLTTNAQNIYVSNSGSDSNAGNSISAPLLTIQTALNIATAGDIIYVRAGTYAEKLWWANSGSSGNPITLTNYNNENVVVSGVNPTNSAQGASILISSKSYIRINGLIFRDNIMNYADGVNVVGSGTDIHITNCEFDNIGWTSSKTTFPSPSNSAHAIIFVGSTSTSLNNIYVGGNYIHDCITGYSESLTIAGNVENFLIEGNTLNSNTNIGIDAAGFFAWTGAPANVNYARSGIIRNNIVSNYAGPEALDAAGGIYTDGGSYITIENNTVFNYKVGFSVGCEVNGNTNNGNIVRNNLAYNCSLSGLFLGSNQPNSVVNNTQVYNNTFYKCGTGTYDNGQIALQNNTGSDIRNNIMYPTDSRVAIVQMGGTTSSTTTLSYNLFWRDNGITSNMFYNVSGDVNSVYADPQFVNANSNDFHISPSSAAVNAGDPGYNPGTDVYDIDGEAREQQGRVDIGADESGGGTTTISVTGVSLSPTSVSLSVGGTEQLSATVSPSNATNQNVTWSSNNTAIATVNSSGLVTAVASGSVTITVSTVDGNQTATSAVTVISSNIPVTGVSLSPTSVSLSVGGTEQLSATVSPSNATNQNVTWSSNNTAIATVNTSGLVTAVASGSVTITISTVDGNQTGTSAVTVISSNVPVTGVSLSPTSVSLSVGGTEQLSTTVSPLNATNQNVTWSSNNTAIATVNSSGLITAVASGSVTITVSTVDGNQTGTSAVTVISSNVPVTIDAEGFESGWGIWNDGGSDARRNSGDAAYASSGTYCIRLRDNTSSSVMTTDNLDLSSYSSLTVSFSYYARSMDNSNEDFWLQISTNGGSSFTTLEEWNRDDEFVNNANYSDQVTISGPFTSTTKLRFRCDASGNNDWVYIDTVVITGVSGSGGGTAPSAPSSLSATANSSSQISLSWSDQSNDEDDFQLQRSLTGTGSWSEITVTSANVTSFSNTGLSAATDYYYRVRARNTNGNSAWSSISSATTQSGGGGGTSITIDGNSNDWSNISVLATNGGTSLKVYDDASDIYFLVSGTLSNNSLVFINTDNNSSSGYAYGWTNAGMDYLIENASSLYDYTGSGSDWAWSGVSGATGVTGASVEIKVSKSSLVGLGSTISVGVSLEDASWTQVIAVPAANNSAATYVLGSTASKAASSKYKVEDQVIEDGLSEFVIYPNPATSIINIDGLKQEEKVRVFDLLGNLIIETTDKEINVSSLNSGIYIIKSESSKAIKFIKK